MLNIRNLDLTGYQIVWGANDAGLNDGDQRIGTDSREIL